MANTELNLEAEQHFAEFLRTEAPTDYDASNKDARHIWMAAWQAARRSTSSVSEDPRLSALAAADQQVAQAAQERRDRAARLGITDAATKAAAPADAPMPSIAYNAELVRKDIRQALELAGRAPAEDAREEVQKTAAKLRAALKPFADAYAPEAARMDIYYTAGDRQKFAARLDANVITPVMTMGDFRRAYEAFNGASSVPAIQVTGREKEEDVWQPIRTMPVGKFVLCAGEMDGPGDWRIKMGSKDGRTRKISLVGSSWKPTLWTHLPAAPSHPSEAKAGEPCAHCKRLPGDPEYCDWSECPGGAAPAHPGEEGKEK